MVMLVNVLVAVGGILLLVYLGLVNVGLHLAVKASHAERDVYRDEYKRLREAHTELGDRLYLVDAALTKTRDAFFDHARDAAALKDDMEKSLQHMGVMLNDFTLSHVDQDETIAILLAELMVRK